MIQGEEGVFEIESCDLIGHLRVVGGICITISQECVVKPFRNNTLRVHQITNCLQNSLGNDKNDTLSLPVHSRKYFISL